MTNDCVHNFTNIQINSKHAKRTLFRSTVSVRLALIAECFGLFIFVMMCVPRAVYCFMA